MMIVAVSGLTAETKKEEAAIYSALKCLAVVDKGNYTESWNKASEYFKNAVTMEQWEQSLRAVRKPLSNLLSRKPKSKIYMTSLP